MKNISSKSQTILQKVKVCLKHPNHYTYVLQKQDNFIYLYDEMTMSQIGVSTTSFTQQVKVIAFSKNNNIFCVFFNAEGSFLSYQHQALLVRFELDKSEGKLKSQRSNITKKKVKMNLQLEALSYYQQDDKESQNLIGVDRQNAYRISESGQILQVAKLTVKNRQINLIDCTHLQHNTWIIKQPTSVLLSELDFQQLRIKDEIHFDQKVTCMQLEPSIKKSCLLMATGQTTIHIIRISEQKLKIAFKFKIENLSIDKLILFNLGVDTNSLNKYRDRVFVIVHGALIKQNDKSFERQSKNKSNRSLCRITNPSFNQRSLYIYEFSLPELEQNYNQPISIHNEFCMPEVDSVRSLDSNQHEPNCIRVHTAHNRLIAYEMLDLAESVNCGEEWVNLGFKFEAAATNRQYEVREDQFETKCAKRKIKQLSQNYLNSWQSALQAEGQSTIKENRLRCLDL